MSSSIYSNDDIDEEYIGSPLEDLEAIEPGADNSVFYKSGERANNQQKAIINNDHVIGSDNNVTIESRDILNLVEEEDDEEDEEEDDLMSVDSEEVQVIKDEFTKFCFQHCQSKNHNLLTREEYERCKLALLNHHLNDKSVPALDNRWKTYVLGNDQREIFHYLVNPQMFNPSEMDILHGDKGNLFLWLEAEAKGSYKRLIPLEDFFDALCFLQDAEEGPFSMQQLFLIAKDIFYGITEELVKRFYILMSSIKKWPNNDVSHTDILDSVKSNINNNNESISVNNTKNNDHVNAVEINNVSILQKAPVTSITSSLPKIEPRPPKMAYIKTEANGEKSDNDIVVSYSLKRPASNDGSSSIHTAQQINKAKELANEIIALNKDQDMSAEYDTTDQLSAHNLFIRRIVDICLDRTVSLSQQPAEVINILESICRHCFANLDPQRHRTKIGNYLKSCRKSRQKYMGKVFVRETPSHTYTNRAQNLMEVAFQRFKSVFDVLECGDNEESPIVTYAVSNCTSVVRQPMFSSSVALANAISLSTGHNKVSIQPKPYPAVLNTNHQNESASFLRPQNPPSVSNNHHSHSTDKHSGLVEKFMFLLNKMENSCNSFDSCRNQNGNRNSDLRLGGPIQRETPVFSARSNVRKDLETIQSAIDILKNYENQLSIALSHEVEPEPTQKPLLLNGHCNSKSFLTPAISLFSENNNNGSVPLLKMPPIPAKASSVNDNNDSKNVTERFLETMRTILLQVNEKNNTVISSGSSGNQPQ